MGSNCSDWLYFVKDFIFQGLTVVSTLGGCDAGVLSV